MKILDVQVLRGPNYWSIYHKLISVRIDIGAFEQHPTDRLPGFTERLVKMLPGLYDHHCSRGKPGGFIERLGEGTWMGHVTEHIALELQTRAGMNCTFGKTTGTGTKGIYNIVFSYMEERAGIYAIHAAIRIAVAAAENVYYNVFTDIENLKKIFLHDRPGPSTSAIIDAAVKRNIPYIRLDEGSLFQLGYGSALKRIEATVTDNTSTIAVDLASDKQKSKNLLQTAAIPVPSGEIVQDIRELEYVIDTIGFPLVIKPNDSNQGKGVSLNINSHEEAVAAFRKAGEYSQRVIAEKYYRGNDYRLLVVNYRFVAASKRTPANVTGDGVSAIRELIEIANSDPLRGDDHENILTKIKVDDATGEFLKFQDLSLDHIPEKGRMIYLRRTANLSTGGTAEDVTELVHGEVKAMAERAARTIGLDICGIDLISEDISLSLKKGNGVVLEVNAAPGFRMHTNPFRGMPRPVGEAVVEMLFPGNSDGRIPVVAVTGTNGKTTTTRLIAHIARAAGYTVGFTATEGIYINNQLTEEGDCTGPVSARKVLCDRSVNFAVLECARGGVLRSGLAFDYCDTGVVTNVAEDHIGLKGINSLEEMARVKSVIPESVKPSGMAILNAGNDKTYEMRNRVRCNVALFSADPHNERIIRHCSEGGVAALYRDRRVELLRGDELILSEEIVSIPAAFGGKAAFMIENILAAILAAWSRDIPPAVIVKALHSFIPSYENNPGRMNFFRFRDFSFMLDYAHNFHGISALGEFIKQDNSHPKIGIVSAAGDRRDVDLYNVGKASASLFDRIIIRVDEDTRGRKDSEIIELIYSGIVDTKKNIPVEIIRNEAEAVRYVLMNAVPGSLIVHFADKIMKVFEIIDEYRMKSEMPELTTAKR
ncbi:MAG TPA: cyanophycin synthetase [Bacteroidales bacterium]|nr:cyanophycin synthetase [Bacteroidales bacterium]